MLGEVDKSPIIWECWKEPKEKRVERMDSMSEDSNSRTCGLRFGIRVAHAGKLEL